MERRVGTILGHISHSLPAAAELESELPPLPPPPPFKRLTQEQVLNTV